MGSVSGGRVLAICVARRLPAMRFAVLVAEAVRPCVTAAAALVLLFVHALYLQGLALE